jgi:hypothetical protein
VSGRVSRQEDVLRLTLVIDDRVDDARELEDTSCDALAEAATLVIAMAVNPELDLSASERAVLQRLEPAPPEPDAPESGSESDRERASEPDAAPASPPSADTAASRAPRRRIPFTGSVRLAGGVGWGALPRVDGSILGAAGLLLPRARFELGGAYAFEQEREVFPGIETRFAGWSLAVRGGPSWPVRTVEFPLLLGVEAGQLIGRARGLDNAEVARAAWVAFTLDAGVFYVPVRQIALGILVEGFIPATRPRFYVGGYDAPVHRPRAGGVRGFATVEARFP